MTHRGRRSKRALRTRSRENKLARARAEITRHAFRDRRKHETVNFHSIAELADLVSKSTAGLLFSIGVDPGEVLSDGRGEGTFERVTL